MWHRRAGKTVAAVNELIKQTILSDHWMPVGLYVAPLRNQAKRVAWPLLKHYAREIPGYEPNEGDLIINLPGNRRIMCLGSDNPDAARGLGAIYAVMDEVAQMDPSMWHQVIRPMLAETDGGATFIGTPKGRMNLFFRLYEDAKQSRGWWANMLRASQSRVIPNKELQELRRGMPLNEYEQEFECSFNAAITGAYYAEEMAIAEAEGRITIRKYDRRLPTVVALDLGWSDLTTAWWAQVEGNQVYVIRCRAWQHSTLAQVIEDIRKHGWPVACFICPHDIQVTEFQTGIARVQVLYERGCRVHVCRGKPGSLAEGIDGVRNLLPRCVFDQDDCSTGIEALVQYRSKYDDLLGVQAKNPVHDWTSHYADGFRTLAEGLAAGAHKDWDGVEYDPAHYRRGI